MNRVNRKIQPTWVSAAFLTFVVVLPSPGFGQTTAGPASGFAPSLKGAAHHLHIQSAAGDEVTREIQHMLGEKVPDAAPAATTAEQVIAAMDAALVERGLVLSIAYMYGIPDLQVDDERAKVRAENRYVAEQVAKYPERLIGACSVNPLAAYAIEEIEICAKDLRIGGFKLHLANSDVNLFDKEHVAKLAAVFQALGKHQTPVVAHIRTRNPEYGARDAEVLISEVLSQAPHLPVQIAHMAGWGGYDDATDAALAAFSEALKQGRLARDLITFDLAAVVFSPAAAGDDKARAQSVRDYNQKLAERIRELGVDNVVFATDWPAWPPGEETRFKIQRYKTLIREELPLSDVELTRIFDRTNAIAKGYPRSLP